VNRRLNIGLTGGGISLRPTTRILAPKLAGPGNDRNSA
jgi:hypothetical protein